LRITLIITLVVLTVEGWTEDSVNLFATFPSGSDSNSLEGLVSALFDAGGLTAYHAFQGDAIVILSLVVVGLSFKVKPMSIRIISILAAAAVISAMAGGVMFVLSGFLNNTDSAQMGGGFIVAYALYFIELYFAKSEYSELKSAEFLIGLGR
jgi:hypothetical protein